MSLFHNVDIIIGNTEGVADTKRAFIMGNALVVGVIEKLGRSLGGFIEDEDCCV